MPARRDIEFPSGDERCAAWLYLPEGGRPSPVIIMAHGLGGTREMRLDAYAERFCEAGYACLVFDYRHFGASGGEPRQLVDVDRQLEDWAAAVDHARSLEQLDAERVVLWGTSFSGGHVLETAANDPKVAAAVSQCPFTDGRARPSAVSWRSSLAVMALATRDVIGARLGRSPVMVATVGEPGSTALMTTPDAEPGYRALVPEGSELLNQIAARLAFRVARYRPGLRAAQVSCPVLFCICEKDSVASPEAAQAHARSAPRGEVRLYDDGHFDIYLGDGFERVVADQLAFLRRHVPPEG